MSLPKDLLDQLLTGYLDNALTGDERARVEQLLRTRPEVADELDELRELRQSLKAVAEADSHFQLEPGFSDRVLDAAVARAQVEGLADDHPLVRLAEQPSVRAEASQPFSWRTAGILVGLAATIAIAVIAFRPSERDLEQGFAVVEPEPDSSLSEVPAGEAFAVSPTPGTDSASGTDIEAGTPETSRLEPASTGSTTDRIANADSSAPDEGVVDQQRTGSDPAPAAEVGPAEAIAGSENPANDSMRTPMQSAPASTGAIFVLHVRRTELGRQTRAVEEAMRLASIGAATEKKISDEIAGFVRSNEQPSEQKATVLYLQAPLKRLDDFYLRLMADQEGVESVGISIALDAPIMNLVTAIKPDPTAVQHTTSLQLVSDNGVIEQFSSQLGELPFAPISRNALSQSEGPDELGQVLVLVE